jgi:putative ABC transport system permease protein
MGTLLRDVRYGLRMLRKNPVFTLIAAITLILGIGANTAVFSVVNALLLHPYPFRGIDQLVLVREQHGNQPGETRMAAADFFDLREQSRAFQGLAASRGVSLNFSDNGQVEAVDAAAATANFFDVLGIRPAAGRNFSPDEEQPGRDQSLIISHGYWKKRFASDPNLVGKPVRVNGRLFTIIGILPAGLSYPQGIQVWVPLALRPEERNDRAQPVLDVLGRMKPGVTQSQTEADLNGLAARLQRDFPKTNASRSLSLLPLRKEQYEYTAPIFLMLQAGAGLVLLLACANLGNLLFARFFSRQREIAIRVALGADRRHVVQALLAEVLVLCLMAGCVAIAISFWTVDLIRNSIPPAITQWVAGWNGVRVDPVVLWFALALTALVAVLLGTVTGLRSADADPNEALKEGSGTAVRFARHRTRNVLIITQFVFATVLLVGAVLMIRGFLHLADIYGGFQPNNVLTMQISLPETKYPGDAQIAEFYQRLLQGVETLPGVQAAASVQNIPASYIDNDTATFTIEGKPASPGGGGLGADTQSISPQFFAALKIPLVQGRAFTAHDDSHAVPMAIISQSMATRFWPNEDPVGKRLKIGRADADSPWMTVVGVVGDIKQNWYDPRPRPTLYLPYLQAPRRAMNLVIRTSFDPMGVAEPVRALVRQIDPEVAISAVQPMNGVISDAISPVRLMGIMMAAFGAVALALSCIGLYGVLAQSVAQRGREFGVRMALGAKPAQLLQLVLGQSLKVCLIGLLLGLPLAVVMSQLMATFLFGVVSLSAPILIGLAALLLVVALLAAFIPARRAAHVDPVVALRYE